MTRAGGPITVGIVGFGKIARDRHVGAIEGNDRWSLHSVADPVVTAAPVPRFASLEQLLDAEDSPAAVAICTPPQARYVSARLALTRGKHVLLEKPPAVTLGELAELRALAERAGVTLFCAWHSRFAPAVAPAKAWLAAREPLRVAIVWREDVRVWHPGQRWIFEPGGFGVFDPGINALSVATAILPRPLLVRDALLKVPENCAAPIAAELELEDTEGLRVTASFDFLQVGPQTWDIEVDTVDGRLRLAEGGRRLWLGEREKPLPARSEYPDLYEHFARLIAEGKSDVDAAPFELVADAFMRARHERAPPFFDPAA